MELRQALDHAQRCDAGEAQELEELYTQFSLWCNVFKDKSLKTTARSHLRREILRYCLSMRLPPTGKYQHSEEAVKPDEANQPRCGDAS